MREPLSHEVIARLTRKDEDGCLIWSGVIHNGRPVYPDAEYRSKNGRYRHVAVAKWVLERAGREVPHRARILHHCEKPLCVQLECLRVPVAETDREVLKKKYAAGATIQELADELKVSYGVMARMLKEAGNSFRRGAAARRESPERSIGKVVEALGESKTITKWSKDPRCKVSREHLRYRLDNGWDMQRAMTKPVRKRQSYRGIAAFGLSKPLAEWAEETGIPSGTLSGDLYKKKLSLEEIILKRATRGTWGGGHSGASA